jgi:hypothetical protein
MTTKLTPQMLTTPSAVKMSVGVIVCFMVAAFALSKMSAFDYRPHLPGLLAAARCANFAAILQTKARTILPTPRSCP